MYKKTNNQEGSVLITERLIVSLFYIGLLARMYSNGDFKYECTEGY